MTTYFLWPKAKMHKVFASLYRSVSVSTIEVLLKDMFPSGFPVLCSSGRASLALSLRYSQVERNRLVGVFPYASHCVLDAVSRIGTPSPVDNPYIFISIFYHQWGFVQEKNLLKNTIEDCVDTLCVPGVALFPGGGNFEIWSLPKILGTSSGGVLWCRDESTAEEIKILRDNQGGGIIPWVLRLAGIKSTRIHLYWQGAEPS